MSEPTHSSFVGRASDVERARELLASESRVITLLGPAGIGKTRLATRVVSETSSRFESVWFVALAEARSESAFIAAVAAALGDSTGDVGHAIAGRGEVLVVLDNVEQVAESAEIVSRWVRLAPRARFVITSRERLRIESEACLELAPLEVADARRLFIERAALARGRYTPSAEELAAIDELGKRLDGNPLAIELAAARTKLFSAPELLARIDRRFELLTGGPRDRTPRQGSLRGAIDWSWELLNDGEKRALARCAVFHGTFAIDAAEAVLGASGLALLESLVDKSLVRLDERFALYETVRDYAAERLRENKKDEDEALDAHVAFYSAFARERAAELRGHDAIRAVASLRADTGNIIAAHRRLRSRDAVGAARIVLALNSLLAMRGPSAIQIELLDAAVADAVGDDGESVRALNARARARLVRGETEGAETDANAAFDIATKSGDVRLRALALEARTRVNMERGRTERARVDIDEALVIYRAVSDRVGEVSALATSTSLHVKQGHLDEARECCERTIASARTVGDQVVVMSLTANLGIVHHWQDRDDEAKRCYQTSLELALKLGDRREESVDRINLALLLVDCGELEEARAEFERALAIQREAGHRQYIGNTVGSLGSLDLVEGNAASARKHFEESLTIFRELGLRRYEAATHRYLGIVALEDHDLDRALASLEEAKIVADEVSDLTSFVCGPLGATLALMGRAADAEKIFAIARKSLETRGEPRAFVLLEIFEAFMCVARDDLGAARAVLARTEGKRIASDARVARRLLSLAIARASASSASAMTITIGPESRWFRIGVSEQVDLSKRRAPRLILMRLVETRRANPGHGISLDDIIAAGWPGERIQPEAAAARAYTAIKTLRELGLGEWLLRRDDGYLLDPDARLAT